MSRKMLAVAAFALMAPIAMAQGQIIPKFGIAAGASLPNGDFSNSNESGYHAMLTLGIAPPLSPVGFRVDGMFNQFPYKGSLLSGENFRVMSLNANATLGMPGVPLLISPYIIGGAGMYRTQSSVASSEAANDLGINIGAGIKFGLAGFGAFGEVRLHNIMADDGSGGTTNLRFIPITFGIVF
jgi:hypothetical protein